MDPTTVLGKENTMDKTKFQLTWGTDNKQIRMDISILCQWGKTKCKEVEGGRIVTILFRVVKEVLHVNVAFEQRSERSEEISYAALWERNHPGIEHRSNILEICSRYSKEAGVAAT